MTPLETELLEALKAMLAQAGASTKPISGKEDAVYRQARAVVAKAALSPMSSDILNKELLDLVTRALYGDDPAEWNPRARAAIAEAEAIAKAEGRNA